MSAARWLASALFLVSIPVFLLLTTVRFVATEPRVYGYSFSHYAVPAVTGVARPELDRAAREIVAYFESNDAGPLDVRVQIQGQSQPLFNAREVLHMHDVRGLFQLVFRLQELSFVYLVVYIAGVYLWSRERSIRRLARQALIAGVATVVVLGVAAIAMLVAFDQLFTEFHVLSFANDFWQLNPATDHLVQMFPQGFWFDVSLGVGLLTAMAGGLIALAGYAYIEWTDRAAERRRRARLRARAEADALSLS